MFLCCMNTKAFDRGPKLQRIENDNHADIVVCSVKDAISSFALLCIAEKCQLTVEFCLAVRFISI